MDYELMRANAVEKYREWLNLWQDDYQFTKEDMRCKPITSYNSGWYHVEVIEVDNSDDGGPSILTVWFSPDWSLTQSRNNPKFTTEPWVIVQEFDTNLQFILNEGKFLNIP